MSDIDVFSFGLIKRSVIMFEGSWYRATTPYSLLCCSEHKTFIQDKPPVLVILLFYTEYNNNIPFSKEYREQNQPLEILHIFGRSANLH